MTTGVDDFLAWIPPQGMPDQVGRAFFRSRTGLDPVKVGGPMAPVLTHLGPFAVRGRDSSGEIEVVLVGDVLAAETNPADSLAKRYSAEGESFAREVNGSWTALIVDSRRRVVLFFTDRYNSRRLFRLVETNCGNWISPAIRNLPTDGQALDPVGIAWFLSNGATHCGHTPFNNVGVLEAASAHEIGPSELVSRRYWQFPFVPDRDGGDETQLGSELLDLVGASARRCATDHANLWLSLSGGYDSRILAAMLREDHADHVKCFSYTHGEAEEGTDAWVARRLAADLGFRHWLVESYQGDLAGHIRQNAAMGQGVSPVCDEIDAWCEVGRMAQNRSRPALMVGDHFLPDRPEAGPALEKKYPPGKMRGFDVLSWLEPALPSGLYQAFQEGIGHDIAGLHAQISHAPTRIDNLIYLEQRLPNVVLAWRQAFAGPYFSVRTPFLDNEVMDFLATIPGPVLRSTFYHDAVLRRYPEAFHTPLASEAGYYPRLRDQLARGAGMCRRRLEDVPSRLDELIPPDVGHGLLDRVAGSRGFLTRAKGRVGRMFGRKPSSACNGAAMRVGEPVLLRRYLVLREALAESLDAA